MAGGKGFLGHGRDFGCGDGDLAAAKKRVGFERGEATGHEILHEGTVGLGIAAQPLRCEPAAEPADEPGEAAGRAGREGVEHDGLVVPLQGNEEIVAQG
jgi:hypothetical protein